MPAELERIREFLRKNTRGMNIREIAEAIHLNRNSVAKYLDVLTTREEVEVKVFGKSKVYYLSQHVPVSSLIRLSSSLMVILNRDLHIVQINDAGLLYLGRLRESVIGMPIQELHPDKALTDSIERWCMEALQGKETDGEICIPGEGSGRFFRVVFTPTVFPDNTRGVILLFEDITERKSAEMLLKMSEEKYRRFIETANEGICAVDRNFIITFANQKLADFLGCTVEEIVGNPISLAMDPGEDADIAEKQANRLAGKKEVYERRFIKKDKTICWLLVSVTPMMKPDGTFDGSLAMLTDITERKVAEKAVRESEIRFQQVADNADEWIWEIDTDGLYRYCSSAVARIIGYTPEELVGKSHFYDLFPQSHRDELKTMTFEAIGRQEPRRRFMNPVVHKNGEIVILETSGSPVYDEDGILTGFRGCDTDLTERWKLESARLVALEQIGKNIQQLTALSARVRNPLTAILAYAGMASTETEEKIGAQVMAIDQIIADIDKGWYESEQVRSQLRKYYEISLPVDGSVFDNGKKDSNGRSR